MLGFAHGNAIAFYSLQITPFKNVCKSHSGGPHLVTLTLCHLEACWGADGICKLSPLRRAY